MAFSHSSMPSFNRPGCIAAEYPICEIISGVSVGALLCSSIASIPCNFTVILIAHRTLTKHKLYRDQSVSACRNHNAASNQQNYIINGQQTESSRFRRTACQDAGTDKPPTAHARSGACQQDAISDYRPNCLKKSFPLSSTKMKAGKFSTSIRQTASMPSSGKSMHSTFLMFSSASTAAGPPMEPR